MRFRNRVLLYALSAVLIISLTAACSIPTVPEEIQIKASPTYNVPAGATTITLSDHFDLDEELIAELQTELGDDGTASGSVVDDIYTIFASYTPISLNTADFFNEEVNLVDSVNQTIDPITFTVPDINETSTVEEDIDPIALPVSVSLPAANIPGVTEAPGAVVALEDGSSIEISTATFDTVTFDQGSLEASMDFTGLSGSVTVTISNVTIVDPSNSYSVIANADQASQDATAASPSATFTFPLADVELPNTFALSMTLSIDSGGDSGTFDVDITPSFTGSPTLKAATGVDFDSVTGSGQEVIAIDNADLVSATINTGGITLNFDLPAGWSGITTDFTLDLSQGGSSLTSTSGASPLTLDLSGVTIDSQDLTLDWSYTVSGTDASFSIDAVNPEVTGSTVATISEFSEIVVNSSELDLTIDEGYVLDQEIIDMVDQIRFLPSSGITFNLTNGLPNDLDIEVNSLVVTPNPTSLTTFEGLSSDVVSQTVDIVTALNIDSTGNGGDLATVTDSTTGESGTGIDMNLAFTLSGYDSGTGNLTIPNLAAAPGYVISAGESYTFSGSVTAQLDINEIDVTNVSESGNFPETGGDPIDLSMLDDYLPTEINLADSGFSATMAIYGPADAMALDVVLLARYTPSGDGSPSVDVLIGSGDPSTLGFDASLYTPVSLDNIDDALTNPDYEQRTGEIPLLNVLNSRPPDLELAYYVEVAGLTVPVATDPADISASLDLAIPLALDVAADGTDHLWAPGVTAEWTEITIPDPDIQAELTVDTDLLDRDVIPDPDVSDILNNLNEASIHLDLVNEMFREAGVVGGYNMLIRVVDGVYNAGDDTYEFDKYIDFSTGDHELSLGLDEIDYIKNNPFTPEIKLYLKEGVLRFNPDAELSLRMWLRVQTDVDYTFALDGEE